MREINLGFLEKSRYQIDIALGDLEENELDCFCFFVVCHLRILLGFLLRFLHFLSLFLLFGGKQIKGRRGSQDHGNGMIEKVN